MVVDADDTYLKFSNPRICQASIDVTDNSTIGAFYRFSPELEQEDYWFTEQDIELISESGDNGIQFKELRDVLTAEDQFMRERNSTAINTTFVLTNLDLQKAKTFLFLSNRLTFRNDHIVRYISYNYIQDISPIKTNDKYGFSNYILSKPEPLERGIAYSLLWSHR